MTSVQAVSFSRIIQTYQLMKGRWQVRRRGAGSAARFVQGMTARDDSRIAILSRSCAKDGRYSDRCKEWVGRARGVGTGCREWEKAEGKEELEKACVCVGGCVEKVVDIGVRVLLVP